MSNHFKPEQSHGIVTHPIATTDESRGSDQMSVLVVDDEPAAADLTATYLERESGDFEIIQKTTAEDGLKHIDGIDAIVSDYDMPKVDGLEFLQEVRTERPELPFILFTSRGNEEIASEAISEGVTDYLQKGGDSSTYSVLANRLKNAIDRYWAVQALYQSEQRFSRLVENSSDVITIISESAKFKYVSPSATKILGYEPSELIGDFIFDYAHPDDRQYAMEEFFKAVDNPDIEPTVRFRFKHPNGDWPVLESRGQSLLDDEVINGFVINSRDITEIKNREAELERQNEQLRNIKQTLSHDITNQLTVANGGLELYRETDDSDHLDRVDHSLSRIEELLEHVLEFSDQNITDIDSESVSLRNIVTDAWSVITVEDAEFRLNESKRIKADPSYLKQLFENLFKNAVEHNDQSVSISIGMLPDGFYVEDDGQGIDLEDADKIFESGFSTVHNKTGFGLAIVEQVVRSHDWEITVVEGSDGGTRFEITGVTLRPEVAG